MQFVFLQYPKCQRGCRKRRDQESNRSNLSYFRLGAVVEDDIVILNFAIDFQNNRLKKVTWTKVSDFDSTEIKKHPETGS